MKRLIEKIIASLKGDPTYRLDPTYSFRQLIFIVYYRAWQVLRGLFVKFKISATGTVFCGRRVIIQHGYQIEAGKSLILEDGVHINALSEDGISFGNNVTIAKGAILVCTGVIASKGRGIRIGNNSAVGARSYVAGQGGIVVGDDVIMGPDVKIFSENHTFSQANTVIRKQGETRKGVVIGNNCWIGAGAILLDGASIGNGCVIAAGSVVTGSMPDNSLIMGAPARVVRNRVSDSSAHVS